MTVVRQFECPRCNAEGKITLKGGDYTYEDIATCPVCGAMITDEDDDYPEPDED